MADGHLRRPTRTTLSLQRSPSTPSSPALPSSRHNDSWVDLTSRPSASSLSSATDEVVTQGLQVVHDSRTPVRRRRLPKAARASAHSQQTSTSARPVSADGSSQEEYDESESESDRVMTSSNEAQPTTIASEGEESATSDVVDRETAVEMDEENAAPLGADTAQDQTCFTPQPNAFSHPPSSQIRSQQHPSGSYFSPTRSSQSRAAHERRSYSNTSHPRRDTITPAHTADHEAALRASLTTLLSCAAAARSLPKADSKEKATVNKSQPPSRSAARVDPSSLRLIPASALPRRRSLSTASSPQAPKRPTSTSPARSPTTSEKGKRKATARTPSSTRRSRSSERASKRLRSVGVDEAGISPTLLTWVLSASVLVLVSALSFSAGYAVGKEDGRFEAGLVRGGGKVGGQCGRQAGRGAAGSGLGLRRRLLGAARGVTA